MAIVTLDEARAQLNYNDQSNTADDAEIQRYIDGLTAVVEEFKGEVIESRQFTEDLSLRGNGTFLLRRVPIISLDAVATVDGATTWNVADLHVNKDTGLVTVLTGSPVSGLAQVTYTAGYATVPANYKQGALLILQHTWETQRGTTGTLAGMVVGGAETYDPRFSYSIPRRALEWLGAPLPGVA